MSEHLLQVDHIAICSGLATGYLWPLDLLIILSLHLSPLKCSKDSDNQNAVSQQERVLHSLGRQFSGIVKVSWINTGNKGNILSLWAGNTGLVSIPCCYREQRLPHKAVHFISQMEKDSLKVMNLFGMNITMGIHVSISKGDPIGRRPVREDFPLFAFGV